MVQLLHFSYIYKKKKYNSNDIHAPIFTVLFTTVMIWKPSKFPLTDE